MKLFSLIISFFLVSFSANLFAAVEPIQTITYNISPMGISQYQDFGTVDFRGNKANLVVFSTKLPTFTDTETIYSDPKTRLPILVERDLSIFGQKEYLKEDYYPLVNTLSIVKYKNGKQVDQYFFKGRAPIQNAILVPFLLRNEKDLKIGSTFDIILPQEYKVKLIDIEEVKVSSGKYKAYHFTSVPAKFEIWISADIHRLPVKMKGVGFPYTLEMKKHTLNTKAN